MCSCLLSVNERSQVWGVTDRRVNISRRTLGLDAKPTSEETLTDNSDSDRGRIGPAWPTELFPNPRFSPGTLRTLSHKGQESPCQNSSRNRENKRGQRKTTTLQPPQSRLAKEPNGCGQHQSEDKDVLPPLGLFCTFILYLSCMALFNWEKKNESLLVWCQPCYLTDEDAEKRIWFWK